MKKLIFACIFLLGGCASAYGEFYQDYSDGFKGAPLIGDPQILSGSRDSEGDVRSMYADGYLLVGESSFNGAIEDTSGAKEQAKKVGAHLVLVYSEFTDSTSGVIPLTSNRPVTTVQSGTVSASSNGGYATGTYTGTSTTYVPQTTLIPYNVRRYDQTALYFAKMGPPCFGAMMFEATPDEKRAAASNRVARVEAVRKNSPAYEGNVIPGDLVVAVNDGAVDLESIVYGKSGETIKLNLLRPIASGRYEPATAHLTLGVCE